MLECGRDSCIIVYASHSAGTGIRKIAVPTELVTSSFCSDSRSALFDFVNATVYALRSYSFNGVCPAFVPVADVDHSHRPETNLEVLAYRVHDWIGPHIASAVRNSPLKC